MIKDRLTEAIEANYDKIQKGDDHIPIGIRGELEVIVKDRDGNIKSYERDHNQVTKLAKMALLHLLAGEIGAFDTNIYSIPETQSYDLQRAYKLYEEGGIPSYCPQIYSSFNPDNHDSGKNLDGQLVSGYGYFYDGSAVDQGSVSRTTKLSQVYPLSATNANQHFGFNFPTKMLFGTGLEDYSGNKVESTYSDDFGTQVTTPAIAALNGYSSSMTDLTTLFAGCSSDENSTIDNNVLHVDRKKRLTNWYSASAYRCRTLQPASVDPIKSTASQLTSNTTAIMGAIKNCFIETASENSGIYNPTTKMAQAPYRGLGYPCFIYATRSTDNFYRNSEGNTEVHYGVNKSFDTSVVGDSAYETEVTYTVIMPAQPVASESIDTYYPYNGWVLRQAGLFCDSRYRVKSEELEAGSELTETAFINKINNGQSDNAKNYRDNVGGQLLFVRNLSSPILKTADDIVTFIWHIFITV